jgi:serine/threonine protein kinase
VAHDYFVLPIANCDLTDSQKKLSIVSACQKVLESKKQLTNFLQIPEAEGDLEHFLKDQQIIDSHEVVSALRNLIVGIKLLHEHRIVHDDIKPDNILYGHNQSGKLWFKFTDFGLGKVDATKYYRQDVKRLANVINKFLKAMNRQLLNEAESVTSLNVTNSISSSFNSKNIYIHTSGINNIDELLKEFDAKMNAYN